jgi:hypothetical protein
MSFDLQRFRGASLAPRQSEVPVPDLAHFFGEGVPPIWIVRGLTGEEIARSNNSSERVKLFAATVDALASAARSEQSEALKAMMGVTDVPEDLAKRFDHLTFGSVDPKISREDSVKLFAAYPVVAYTLTNKILELTGLGPDLGKAPHSTDGPTS